MNWVTTSVNVISYMLAQWSSAFIPNLGIFVVTELAQGAHCGTSCQKAFYPLISLVLTHANTVIVNVLISAQYN